MSNDSSYVIERIVEEFNLVQKEFQAKAKTALQSAFKEFFDANPRIEGVYWRQYTPYFNDGDTCEFSVGEMYALAGPTSEDEQYDHPEDRSNTFDDYGRYGDEAFNKEWAAEIKNFSKFNRTINQLPDDVFLQTFGDHSSITATRAGFDVEEYEHE